MERRKHREWAAWRSAVYGGERWCLALVGRGKVTTATDNAGPADDTRGNAI